MAKAKAGGCGTPRVDLTQVEATFALEFEGTYPYVGFYDVGFLKADTIVEWTCRLVRDKSASAKHVRTLESVTRVQEVDSTHEVVEIAGKFYLAVRGKIGIHKRQGRYYGFSTTIPKKGDCFQYMGIVDVNGNVEHMLSERVTDVEQICKNLYKVNGSDRICYIIARNLTL